MKNLKPIFIENSFIPKLLSFFAPIKISAITIAFLVFSREELSEQTKKHETIHFQQGLELAFVGFWLVYAYDFIKGLKKYKSGRIAYIRLRAEREAAMGARIPDYLSNRVRYQWLKKFKI